MSARNQELTPFRLTLIGTRPGGFQKPFPVGRVKRDRLAPARGADIKTLFGHDASRERLVSGDALRAVTRHGVAMRQLPRGDLPAIGQHSGYDYDNIGNRESASSGGDVNGWNLRTTGYEVNNLNQYTTITTPGYKDIIGAALATNTVTVNNGTADRKVEYFHREISIANSSSPVWQAVTVSSGGVSSNGGFVCPKNSQTLTYDLDGNLTFDGVWTYEWDGENRLKAMTMTNVIGIPNAQRKRLEFAYDYMNRRVQKVVSTWNGSAFAAPITNKFAYDGWNLMAKGIGVVLTGAAAGAGTGFVTSGLNPAGAIVGAVAGAASGLLALISGSINGDSWGQMYGKAAVTGALAGLPGGLSTIGTGWTSVALGALGGGVAGLANQYVYGGRHGTALIRAGIIGMFLGGAGGYAGQLDDLMLDAMLAFAAESGGSTAEGYIEVLQ